MRWSVAVLAAFLGVVGPAAGAQSVPPESAPSSEIVDRIVAVVDEDPILSSDLDRAVGLGLIDRQPGESELAFRRRVLDLLLEERLRAHEIDRFGFYRDLACRGRRRRRRPQIEIRRGACLR